MNRDFRLMLPAVAFVLVSLACAAYRGLLPLGLLFLVLFVTLMVSVHRTNLPVPSLLFAGEPLCLLSGPGTPIILLAHLLLLGIFLQRSGSLEGKTGWGAYLATALLTLPCTFVMPVISPLLAILLPISLAGGLGAGAFLGTLRLQGQSGGGSS